MLLRLATQAMTFSNRYANRDDANVFFQSKEEWMSLPPKKYRREYADSLIPIRNLRYGSDLKRRRRHSLAALCLPVSTPAVQRVLAETSNRLMLPAQTRQAA